MEKTQKATFKAYYWRVISRAWDDARGHVKSGVVAALCAIAASILRAHWGLLEPSQKWLTGIANALPAIIIMGGFLVFFIVRAPWNLHNDTHQERAEQRQQLKEAQDTVLQE